MWVEVPSQGASALSPRTPGVLQEGRLAPHLPPLLSPYCMEVGLPCWVWWAWSQHCPSAPGALTSLHGLWFALQLLRRLESENAQLEAALEWRRRELVFWQWMVSEPPDHLPWPSLQLPWGGVGHLPTSPSTRTGDPGRPHTILACSHVCLQDCSSESWFLLHVHAPHPARILGVQTSQGSTAFRRLVFVPPWPPGFPG